MKGSSDSDGHMLKMLFCVNLIAAICTTGLPELNVLIAIMNICCRFLVKGDIFAPPVIKKE